LPATAAWYVGIGGVQAGPFDLMGLTAKVRDGSLTRTTLVWKQGMSGWAAAESVAELHHLFPPGPPPLPPQ
jgi:hypothetical protein